MLLNRFFILSPDLEHCQEFFFSNHAEFFPERGTVGVDSDESGWVAVIKEVICALRVFIDIDENEDPVTRRVDDVGVVQDFPFDLGAVDTVGTVEPDHDLVLVVALGGPLGLLDRRSTGQGFRGRSR